MNCKKCGRSQFIYDAGSCALCDLAAARAEVERLREALDEIYSFRRANIHDPDSWRIAAEVMRLTALKALAGKEGK